jgi:ankyrin repeat protein
MNSDDHRTYIDPKYLAILITTYYGNDRKTNELLTSGVDINKFTNDGMSPLLTLSRKNLNMVRNLIKNGASVGDGQQLFHISLASYLREGKHGILDMLIRKKLISPGSADIILNVTTPCDIAKYILRRAIFIYNFGNIFENGYGMGKIIKTIVEEKLDLFWNPPDECPFVKILRLENAVSLDDENEILPEHFIVMLDSVSTLIPNIPDNVRAEVLNHGLSAILPSMNTYANMVTYADIIESLLAAGAKIDPNNYNIEPIILNCKPCKKIFKILYNNRVCIYFPIENLLKCHRMWVYSIKMFAMLLWFVLNTPSRYVEKQIEGLRQIYNQLVISDVSNDPYSNMYSCMFLLNLNGKKLVYGTEHVIHFEKKPLIDRLRFFSQSHPRIFGLETQIEDRLNFYDYGYIHLHKYPSYLSSDDLELLKLFLMMHKRNTIVSKLPIELIQTIFSFFLLL